MANCSVASHQIGSNLGPRMLFAHRKMRESGPVGFACARGAARSHSMLISCGQSSAPGDAAAG